MEIKVPKHPNDINSKKKLKEPETVRQRAEKESAKRTRPTKRSKLASKIHKPLSTLKRVGSKEYHPIKAPDKKGFRYLNKKIPYIPKFIKNSWEELKKVTWPTFGVAMKLTFAVIVFSAVFAVFVQILDFIFNKLVKEIILR